MKRDGRDYIKASQTKRFVAYIIDWFIGSLIIMLPVSMYYLSQTSDVESVSNVNINTISSQFGTDVAITVGLFSIALGLLYYVLVPFVTKGQSIGKRAFELKIVRADGTDVDLKTIIIRQFVVVIMIEMYLYSVSHTIIYIAELVIGNDILKNYYALGMVISIVSCILTAFSHEHLAIHDRIAKTKVVGIKNDQIDQKI